MEFYKAKKAILLMIVMFLLFTFTSCSPVDNTADNAYESEEGVETEIANSPTQSSIINQNQSTEPETTEYTVTFINWDNDNLKTENVVSGNSATAPSPQARKGYTFTGWDKSFDKVESDIVITAVFNINSYTVAFNTDGGSSVASVNQNFDTQITSPENPTKEGYIFSGWFPALPAKMPAANSTHTAQWSINRYTLTFNSNGGTAIQSIIQDYGTTVTPPTNPTREGYTFTGWTPALPATMPAASSTYTAQWTQDPIEVTSATDSTGLAYEVNADETSCTITGIGSCTDTDIIIPSTIHGYTVTSIGMRAFDGWSSLTSIIIPDGVTSIGSFAFWDCTSLTSITIPDSVTSIGVGAFGRCTSLTSIIIPDSVTSIGASVFAYCFSLTSIIIPDSVTSIGDKAFDCCFSLTSITIPDSVTSIGAKAFYNCRSLTSITIPDSVTSIGLDAFGSCTSLTSIIIPDSVTSIGDSAFAFCDGLTSITIPDGVTSIGYHAFKSCTGLTSITIPDGVTSIGDNAFDFCTGLTSIIIPDSVTSIGDSAFAFCYSLTSIIIPDSVTSIGYSAFYNCSSLTSVTIPDSVTSIGSYAFGSCISLTSITIPNSVTSIGESAFAYCSSLTSITIGADVEIAGDVFDVPKNTFEEDYATNGKAAGTYTYKDAAWLKTE